ncbi:MAG: hypothetical protein AAFR17_13105, partial [Pseudomonadota bacterium]
MNAILDNPTTPEFKANAKAALANEKIQSAMALQTKWRQNRANAAEAVPEFEQLRDAARDIKNHVLG